MALSNTPEDVAAREQLGRPLTDLVDVEDDRQLVLAGERGGEELLLGRGAVDQQGRGAGERGHRIERHRLAAVAAVAGAQRAVARDHHHIARRGPGRPQHLHVDPHLPNRGPGELAAWNSQETRSM